MSAITLKEVERVYLLAKNVYFNNLTRNEALEEAEKFGMNRGSAHDLITNFKYMIDGFKYTRTNNNHTTEYYLEHIYKDFGLEKLINATHALHLHIEYYENLRKTTMHGLRKILDKYEKIILNFKKIPNIVYADELPVPNNILVEGAKKQVIINAYERNQEARNKCIDFYGYNCSICEFNFEKVYGDLGKSFIHVHHIKPLSEISQEYEVDPIKDLIPVCPNCHAMLHRTIPAISINELKIFLKQ